MLLYLGHLRCCLITGYWHKVGLVYSTDLGLRYLNKTTITLEQARDKLIKTVAYLNHLPFCTNGYRLDRGSIPNIQAR